MSTTPTTPRTSPESGGDKMATGDFAADNRSAATLRDSVNDYVGRLRGGDMGSLPAVLGLVVLMIVFGLASDRFFSLLNMANLVVQAGPICLLAMGLVFVLLLGEIDLSAGVAGGVGATVSAMFIVEQGLPWYLGVIGAIVTGAVIGLIIGELVSRLGIPSFVVTLAFFLGLQGVILRLIGDGGSIRVDDPVIRGLTIDNVPVTAGWVAAIVLTVVFAVGTLLRQRRQVANNLQHDPMSVVLIKIAVVAAVVLGITAMLSIDRSLNPSFPIAGIPYVLPVVVVLLILWTFVLDRTTFGRHLYAVGGNAEAARRAGISVLKMRVYAFVICSSMAVISGIVQSSYTGKVSTSSGGGNVLLYAVGAAVIGGTSLFGGKGRALDAVIGGVVIATIANGLGLLNQAAYINFLVTGGVLLIAASVDAISRRRRSAAGI
ncbi:Xylose transport system permease protein XylH [Nocardioides aquaticus]|uniref:Xylose transport system permease protein XylH n=1 Tax=Nocardioides aquaticus TaxID=160826 RepID=A0ABX8EE66_9ACTN|nr:ABC transporter permease [Nocardioides aquaticus]QVT78779.1 Xylose transport system permease protein XylH [Nocardioides aquaticus]